MSEPTDDTDAQLAQNEVSAMVKDRARSIARSGPETLRRAYTDATGMVPDKHWGFKLDEIAWELARRSVEEGEDTARFLRESMIAWVFRSGGGFQEAPKVPFFARTYLLAESALEYLAAHRDRIRRFSRFTADPDAFHKRVYEEVFLAEGEYWSQQIEAPPDFTFAQPTLYWLLVSYKFDRFGDHPGEGVKHMDALWPLWGDLSIEYFGRPQRLYNAFCLEQNRLRASPELADTVVRATEKALWDAALQTWSRLGHGRLMGDERGHVVTPPGLEQYRFSSHGGETLLEWELRWRKHLAPSFDQDVFLAACRSAGARPPKLTEADKARASVLKEAPFLMRAIEAADDE